MNAVATRFPATYHVHTVNGIEPCCELHATQLSNVMRHLGSTVRASAAPADAICRNCVNEAKKAERES